MFVIAGFSFGVKLLGKLRRMKPHTNFEAKERFILVRFKELH